MLDEIRKHVPAARSLSDGRLIAVLIAGVVLVSTLTDLSWGGIVMIGAMLGVWYAMRHHQRSPDVALADDAEAHAPETLQPQAVLARRPSQDPLVARAEALLRRVETRG